MNDSSRDRFGGDDARLARVALVVVFVVLAIVAYHVLKDQPTGACRHETGYVYHTQVTDSLGYTHTDAIPVCQP